MSIQESIEIACANAALHRTKVLRKIMTGLGSLISTLPRGTSVKCRDPLILPQ